METFSLVPRGPFSLAASIKSLEGFTPAQYSAATDDVLELAFPVEGSWQTAGVRVRQDAGGETARNVDAAAGHAAAGHAAAGDAAGTAAAGVVTAGDPDAVADQEPRMGRAVALAYGLPAPATPEQIRQISENWRPYRTWVTLLLRTQLEEETGEITGRRERAGTR